MSFKYKKPQVIIPLYTSSPLKNKKSQVKIDSPLFKEYRKKVFALTEENCKSLTDFCKRGFFNHHVDHMISIHYGFVNNISAENIADASNLRMIYYKDNMRKGIKCEITESNIWIINSTTTPPGEG